MRKNYDLIWVREHLGLTQQEAGALVDVSRVTFNRWELGVVAMPPLKYARFLKAAEILQKDIPTHPDNPVVHTTAPDSVLTTTKGYDDQGFPPKWDWPTLRQFKDDYALQTYVLKLIEGKQFKEREAFRISCVEKPDAYDSLVAQARDITLKILRANYPKSTPFLDVCDACAQVDPKLRAWPDEDTDSPVMVAASSLRDEGVLSVVANTLALVGVEARKAAVEANDPGGVKRAAAKAEKDQAEAAARGAARQESERAEALRAEEAETQRVLTQKRAELKAARLLEAEEEEKRFRADRKAEREAEKLAAEG